MYEEETDAQRYPPSRIFHVDEPGYTVVQNKHPNIPALKSKRLE